MYVTGQTMKHLKSYMALLSLSFTTCATQYKAAQDFFATALGSIQEHQTPLFMGAACATTATYFGYAIYLDGAINNRDGLWHWTMHHIKDGIIDQDTLMMHIEERHPDLKALHPLTAIFATAHAAQMEIDMCLTLRSVLKNLKNTVHSRTTLKIIQNTFYVLGAV